MTRLRSPSRKNSNCIRGALLLLLLAATVSPACATVVNGSYSLWAYSRDDSVDHLMVSPALSLNFSRFAGDAWRFESTLRGFADFRNGESANEQIRILRGMFIYAPVASKWEWRLGQQWLAEGVGRGSVAGLWVKRKFNSQAFITAYGGAKLLDSYLLDGDNPKNGVAGGIHARTKLLGGNAGVSYYYLSRGGDLLYHSAGLDCYRKPAANLTTRIRLDMNLAQSTIERGQLLADWAASRKLTVTGEFRLQTPRVYEDSYFARFLEDSKTTYLRGMLRWKISPHAYARFGGATLFTENPDPLYKLKFAAGHPKYVELGYTYWLSVTEGKMNGIYLQAKYDCPKSGGVFAGFDFARGSNADEDLRPASESQASYFGAEVKPTAMMSLSARAEHIRTLYEKSDWRGLFSIHHRFSIQ